MQYKEDNRIVNHSWSLLLFSKRAVVTCIPKEKSDIASERIFGSKRLFDKKSRKRAHFPEFPTVQNSHRIFRARIRTRRTK